MIVSGGQSTLSRFFSYPFLIQVPSYPLPGIEMVVASLLLVHLSTCEGSKALEFESRRGFFSHREVRMWTCDGELSAPSRRGYIESTDLHLHMGLPSRNGCHNGEWCECLVGGAGDDLFGAAYLIVGGFGPVVRFQSDS